MADGCRIIFLLPSERSLIALLKLLCRYLTKCICIGFVGIVIRANILERPGEGLMMIDFDDMVMGPAAQDLWLLLPGYAQECRHEIDLILEGYEAFVNFDDRQLRMMEVLRAMRMIYFLAWCSTQAGDYRFQTLFPDWEVIIFGSGRLRIYRSSCISLSKSHLGKREAEMSIKRSVNITCPGCGTHTRHHLGGGT